MSAALPEQLQRFIHACIPTYQAAEVLLFLAANPERAWGPDEIVVAMRPVVVTVPAVRQYLAHFGRTGIVSEAGGRVSYAPSSKDVEEAVRELAHAYNERPVTLIRAIYRIADDKIQSFADAFKIRDDQS